MSGSRNKTSNADLAAMPGKRIKGNASSSAAAPSDLTPEEAGQVIASQSGDGTKYLDGEGNFTTPGGGGGTPPDEVSIVTVSATLKRAALTGDVTAAQGANATTIANNAVTYAKMQDVSATDKVLGRSSSGAGDVEEIACTAAGRALIDDATAADQRTTLGLGTVATLASDTDGTLAANSDTRVATQKAVKTYVDAAVVGLLDLKGSTDCSANPNYPAASKGDYYVVSVAGKIGGASGTSVDAGDVYFATADNAGGTEGSVGGSWAHIEHNLLAATATPIMDGVGAVGTGTKYAREDHVHPSDTTRQPYVRVEHSYTTAQSTTLARPSDVDDSTPIEVIMYGPGGGGAGGMGGGNSGTAGHAGGAGGGGGVRVAWRGRVGDLTWPLALTVGAGGAHGTGGVGGPGAVADGTDGSAGTTTTVTGVGSAFSGGGGRRGSASSGSGGGGGGSGSAGLLGGTSTTGVGGGLPCLQVVTGGGVFATGGAGGPGAGSSSQTSGWWGEDGGGGGAGRTAVSGANQPAGGTSLRGGGGGGCGGHTNSSNVVVAGSEGGNSGVIVAAGGGGGAFNAGADGSDGAPGSRYHGGTGGGGGAAVSNGAGSDTGKKGGKGGSHGGGGGGGGACHAQGVGATGTGGIGGDGGDGAVYIIIG